MPDSLVVKIDGQVDEELGADILKIQVDTDLFLPAMFSITLEDAQSPDDGNFEYTDSSKFEPGAVVEIIGETDEIAEEAQMVSETLMIGEITAIEPFFDAGGRAALQLRGYDRSHRLTRGKKTRTYGDANPSGSGITEEQIIKTIVQETDGITKSTIDSSGFSSIKYPYVMQYNQTDWEFLWSRAHRLGYQVYVEDQTLHFQKADAHRGKESSKPSTQVWGRNLSTFEPRLTLMHQATSALVKGWDPHKKAAIEGEGKTDSSATVPKIGLAKKGSAMSKTAFKDPAEEVIVAQPVLTVDQAKAMAAARFAEAESEFVQAEATCRQGDPRLIAGRLVTIEGVGQKFSGDYYVTQARHVYSHGAYEVTFGVTGRIPNTLSYLLNERNGHDRGLVQGVVTAKVTSLEDPEELGRVQVMFPWLPKYKDADLSSNWARLASPMGGNERGFLFLPEIDDEVLVAFEHGDLSYPYIVGVLWNKTDKPPKGTKSTALSGDKKKVDERIIRSRSGHLILLDDTDGEEQIIIQDKTEKNKIIINSKENTLSVEIEKDMTFTSSQGATTIDSSKAITITTPDDLTIECKNLTIKATMAGKVEAGTDLGLKGGVGAKVENSAGAKVVLQGPMVNVN